MNTKYVMVCVLLAHLLLLLNTDAKSVDKSTTDRPEAHSAHHVRHRRQKTKTIWTILNQPVEAGPSSAEEPALLSDNHVHRSHAASVEHKKAEVLSPNCPKCHNRPELRITEEELTALRIKYVKNQILSKLKLTERPRVSMMGLPKPVVEGATINLDEDEESSNGIQDEFYAKTTQKIIFPQLDMDNCKDNAELGTSMCFSVQIPPDIDHRDVDSAELWVNKQEHVMNVDKHSLLVGEVERWDSKRVVKNFAIQETNVTEEWVKIDIAWRIQNWIQYNDLHHVIEISCNTCDRHPSQSLLSLDQNFRPFIVVKTHMSRKQKRQKRNINCSPGVSECCREKVYISFAEIGWDDWIVHPLGYHAYFCRGSCSSAASITMGATIHANVMQKYSFLRKNDTKSLEMVPCCTATQYSSMNLFYMENNTTASQKNLPNMVVEACGCM